MELAAADDSSEQSSLLLAQSAVVPAGAADARSGAGCCCGVSISDRRTGDCCASAATAAARHCCCTSPTVWAFRLLAASMVYAIVASTGRRREAEASASVNWPPGLLRRSMTSPATPEACRCARAAASSVVPASVN